MISVTGYATASPDELLVELGTLVADLNTNRYDLASENVVRLEAYWETWANSDEGTVSARDRVADHSVRTIDGERITIEANIRSIEDRIAFITLILSCKAPNVTRTE